MSSPLGTPRLALVPITLAMVEAVLLGRREDAEALVGARMPERWPNRELIERAFAMSLETVRAAPDARLWGAQVMIADAATARRRVIGSVVFRGQPDADGTAEIAYGVDEASQGQGFATEAVGACTRWALNEGGAKAVQATTFGWHRASIRVLEKVGMRRVGQREHETLGEMWVYETRVIQRA
jgi:RimJ/RimL family protein N-acetyltransferase